MKTTVVRVVVGMAIVLIGIQFIPVNRTNPPMEEEIVALPDVKAILKRACYDCHSNETIWPWYSQVAPASWLLAWDVAEGREELNFSTWNRYTQKKR
ncbi:MAG: heme-binding domain-containing protein, partial [Nitrospirota bacterium]|nr:heme-binding domain-containing protein [Nitrospirota bacterium]